MQQALEAEGQTYRGFLITKYLPLPELQSTLIELVHQETGARVIQIANSDQENLYCLSFQTLPDSSNGVAHILEHTVLCGSEKFPVKDPFFAMTRRSLNTYMNALTGQDFTCYPASSQVEKDFYNLLEIYLDAVFHPKLTPMSFLQEGHRLAFAEAGNPKSALQIQGIVYNEMKGAMTGSDGRLWHYLFKHLVPDLPYAYNSGGDPKEIPNLTHEELIEFHKTFYHPSRCLFFFYGNLPLSKNLDKIAPTLEATEKSVLLPPLPLQARFAAPVFVREHYGVAADEDSAKKTIVALSFLTASISEQTELLGLSLIDSLLTDTDVSPLKLALLQSNLCTMADSSLDLEMSEAPWTLICKGCEAESAEKILQLFFGVLETLAKTGFDPEAIEASLHQLEFQRSEIGSEGAPFGLSLFFRAALSKQHGADPESALLIHSLFADLRERLKDPSYLPSLLKRYFLKNQHYVCLTLLPDQGLEEKEKHAEEKKLHQIRETLTEEKIQEILDQEKALAQHQETLEHQSLECLPKISLSEVPESCKDYPLSLSHIGSLSIAQHTCFTNRIVYADLSYDLPHVAAEDLVYLPFWARCMTEIGCEGRSYAELLQLQQSAVGELTASLSPTICHGTPHLVKPALNFRAKALDRKTPQLLDLLQGFSLSANFLDAPRIQELLSEHATSLQNKLPKKALGYAIQMALSGFSRPSALQQIWQGLPYYQAVLRWAESPASLPETLDRLYKELLGASKPTLVLSVAEEERSHLDRHLPAFAKALPQKNAPAWKTEEIPMTPIHSQGKIIASPVAFSALAFNTISYSDPDSAALMVATDLMENIVLHNEIREKGGAYGSGASFAPASGHFYFYSYRDPHLTRTYHAFLKAIDRIAAGKFEARELEEAKLGILQDLDAPLPPSQRARVAYGSLRSGRTLELRDTWRRTILDCSKEEVATAVAKHLATQKEKGIFVSFAGEALLKKEAKTLPFSFEISVV